MPPSVPAAGKARRQRPPNAQTRTLLSPRRLVVRPDSSRSAQHSAGYFRHPDSFLRWTGPKGGQNDRENEGNCQGVRGNRQGVRKPPGCEETARVCGPTRTAARRRGRVAGQRRRRAIVQSRAGRCRDGASRNRAPLSPAPAGSIFSMLYRIRGWHSRRSRGTHACKHTAPRRDRTRRRPLAGQVPEPRPCGQSAGSR
jgi:hypothetical protein